MATLIKGRRVVSENPFSPKDKVLRLEPTDDPAAISLEGVARVEVNFPKFADGRGYSIVREIRDLLSRHRSGGSRAVNSSGSPRRSTRSFPPEDELQQGREGHYEEGRPMTLNQRKPMSVSEVAGDDRGLREQRGRRTPACRLRA